MGHLDDKEQEEACADQARIRRKAQKETETMRAIIQYESRIGMLLDKFTSDVVLKLGVPYMEDHVGRSNGPLVLATAYILALFVVSYVVWCVVGCFVSIMYLYLWYVSAPQGVGALVLCVMWIVHKAVSINTAKDRNVDMFKDFRTPTVTKDPSYASLFHNFDILLIVAVVGGIYYWSSSSNMVTIIPVVLLVWLVRNIPGPGGNSVPGVLSLILLMAFLLLCVPQALQEVAINAARVTRTFRGEAPVAESVSPTVAVEGVSKWFVTAPIADLWHLDGDGISVAVAFVAACLAAWLFYDDLLGPGFCVTSITRQTTKQKEGVIPPSMAGIFDSPWIFSSLITALSLWFLGSWLNLFVGLTAFAMVYTPWNYYGASVWSGRGQAATATNVRTDMGINFGSGPLGLRLAVIRLIIVLCIGIRGWAGYSNLVVLTLLVLFLYWKNERVLAVCLTLLTWNPQFMICAFLRDKPFSGTLLEGLSYGTGTVGDGG